MEFGVASSGLLPAGASVKSLSPANACVPHPEIRKTFSPLSAAFSAGAAWSGACRDPSESPQPGAIPTTARAN